MLQLEQMEKTQGIEAELECIAITFEEKAKGAAERVLLLLL